MNRRPFADLCTAQSCWNKSVLPVGTNTLTWHLFVSVNCHGMNLKVLCVLAILVNVQLILKVTHGVIIVIIGFEM